MASDFCREAVYKSVDQSEDLSHHGILGMHWGIRRYQDYGHGGYSPDSEGKFVGKGSKAYNKELQKKIKKRDQIVKKATIAAINRTTSMKKVAKYQVAKTEDTSKNYDAKIERAMKAYDYWDKNYKSLERSGKHLTTRLRNIYGNDAIKDMPYKNGIIKGAVFSPAEATVRSIITAAAIATISPTTAVLAMPSKKVKSMIEKIKSERDAGMEPESGMDKAIIKALDTMESAKDKIVVTVNRHLKKNK